MDGNRREAYDLREMDERVEEKSWQIPAHEGKGPVTMSLRLPELTITDSDGRFIVISPRQCAIVGSRLSDIDDWLQYGSE